MSQFLDLNFKKIQTSEKKLTYNFVTSKQLKRGHNFGVVYYTPNNLEEEIINQQEIDKKNIKNKIQKEKEKINKLEEDLVPPVYGRQHASVSTIPVETTLRPKPLTFNKFIQTTDFIDRPRSPLIWKEPTGISKNTQIEDGDLFNFDFEVEPILNVLISKTLDIARMEILEEEEIKTIIKHQRHFEELRNRELMEVENLEDSEIRRKEEIERRYIQQKERYEILKINQKKLISRYYGKEYFKNLKTNTLGYLINNGVFNYDLNKEFEFHLIPYINNKVEKTINTNQKLGNKVYDFFFNKNKIDIFLKHKISIKNHHQELKDNENNKILAIQMKEEKRRKKKEEKEKKEKEEKIENLKKEIISNLLLKSFEMVDDIIEIFDSDGMMQINKKGGFLTGGYISQWAIIFIYMNSENFDFLNSDKLLKVFEIFFQKMPPVSLLIPDYVLSNIKEFDKEINSIDDIIKSNDSTWNLLVNLLLEYYLNNIIIKSIEKCFLSNKINETKFIDAYKMIFELVFKLIRTVNGMEKSVKFFERDQNFNEDISLKGIFIISHDTIQKSKLQDLSKKHKKQGAKIIFDPEINEKLLILCNANENIRVFVFNPIIDREIRFNMIECINKVFKIEHLDKDSYKIQIEEEMISITNNIAINISEELGINIFEYYYQLQNENNENN